MEQVFDDDQADVSEIPMSSKSLDISKLLQRKSGQIIMYDPVTDEMREYTREELVKLFLTDEPVSVIPQPPKSIGTTSSSSPKSTFGVSPKNAAASKQALKLSATKKLQESVVKEAAAKNAARLQFQQKLLAELMKIAATSKIAIDATKYAITKCGNASRGTTSESVKTAAEAEETSIQAARKAILDAENFIEWFKNMSSLFAPDLPVHSSIGATNLKGFQGRSLFGKSTREEREAEVKELMAPYAGPARKRGKVDKSPVGKVDKSPVGKGHSMTRNFCLLRNGQDFDHPGTTELSFLQRCGMGIKPIKIPSNADKATVLELLLSVYPMLEGELFYCCEHNAKSDELVKVEPPGPQEAYIIKSFKGIVYLVPASNIDAKELDNIDDVPLECKICCESLTYIKMPKHLEEHEQNGEHTYLDWLQSQPSYQGVGISIQDSPPDVNVRLPMM